MVASHYPSFKFPASPSHYFWLLLFLCLPVCDAFQQTAAQFWLLHTRTSKAPPTSYVVPLYARKKPSPPEGYGSNLEWLKDEYNLPTEWLERMLSTFFLQQIDKLDSLQVKEKIEMVQEELKLGKAEIRKILLRKPGFLLPQSSTVLKSIQFCRDLGMEEAQIRLMALRHSQFLGRSEGKLQTMVEWFQTRFQLDDKKVVVKVLTKHPPLLSYSVHENLEPTVSKVQQHLRLDNEEIARVFTRMPSLLSLNFTTGIEPKLTWMEQFFALERAEVAKTVMRHPELLAYSVNGTLEHNMLWLQKRLAMNEDQRRRVFLKQPTISYLSPHENIEPTLQWLGENLQLQPAQLCKYVIDFPVIVSLSVTTNLQPTLDFYRECVGVAEAVEFVKKNPRHFSPGLETRLKPRRQQCEEVQVGIDEGVLSNMGKYKQEDWEAYLQRRSKT